MLVERLHPRIVGRHGLLQPIHPVLAAQELPDVRRRDEDLDCGYPSTSVGAREEPLRHDGVERFGNPCACDLLLLGWKERQQPCDGRDGIGSEHRADHQMAGLGCLDRRVYGLGVADLSEDDDVGVLA
jgi:hypothetical protein